MGLPDAVYWTIASQLKAVEKGCISLINAITVFRENIALSRLCFCLLQGFIPLNQRSRY